MAIALSQEEYWTLLDEPTMTGLELDVFERIRSFPQALGCGSVRQIYLRDGLELAISDYFLHDQLTLHCPEREHPLEYSFFLSGGFQAQSWVVSAGQYALYGSGVAPIEQPEWFASEQVLEVNVHIDPDLFLECWNSASTPLQPELQHLVQSNSQPYYWRSGSITTAMQTALQQILHCPFDGMIKRIYLESKVWELMALLIDQELAQQQKPVVVPVLKRDDIDRIHYAKEILLQRFDNPPSLLELARQVGLNDCTLKRGFRQVFGTTAFGYLHEYRLEQARQLLKDGHLNVSEVARRVGFVSRSHFAAAFRKKFGLTPREYLIHHKNSA